MNDSIGRLVRANVSLTLDGRFTGPGGAGDIGAIGPYMSTDVARGQLARIHDGYAQWLVGAPINVGPGSALGYLSRKARASLRSR
jgi:hypothetical protein